MYEPRVVPSCLKSLPLLISYSDGEGGSAGVGAAVWAPWLHAPLAVYSQVPPQIRRLWAFLVQKEEYNDIFLVEALGPLILLTAFPRVLRNALWIHFVDNTAAEASLIGGSSSLSAAAHIVGLT